MLDVSLLGESNWRGPSGLKLPFYKRVWFQMLVVLLILGAFAAFVAFQAYVQPLIDKAETYNLEEAKKLEVISTIYNRKGGELGTLYLKNRLPISIRDVPQHFKDALVAQEDERFYSHHGVDWTGLGRAIYLRFRLGETTQGGSGITQQLARNAFHLKDEMKDQGIARKVVEGALAIRLEKRYSKDEIMEMYLNLIFFGKTFDGLGAAAKGYYGKEVKELTLDESATLCGLIKSPNNYAPSEHPEASRKSRDHVLDRMVTENKITAQQAAEAKAKPIATVAAAPNPRLTYAYDAIKQQVIDIVGEEKANQGGFRIYTSIDPVIQKAADEAVRKRLAEVEAQPNYAHQTYDQYKKATADFLAGIKAKTLPADSPRPKTEYLQGAALVIDNSDGSVLAVTGGRDFKHSQLNRALTTSSNASSKRPVGTAFLPFLYAAAFSTPAFFPGTPVDDSWLDNRRIMLGGMEGILGDWGSEQIDRPYAKKPVPARDALARSLNAATVRLGDLVGSEFQRLKPDMIASPAGDNTPPAPWMYTLAVVKGIAEHAGITSPLRDYPSAFLGASEAGLDEMCLAYTIFPNGGSRPQALHIIQRITDAQDNVVYQIKDSDVEQHTVIDDIAAYQTHSCLTDALERGTGSLARERYALGKFPAAGKTGTHYGFTDLWHLGYTSNVTCGVWVGFDKPKAIYPNAFSSHVALPIWSDIMNATVADYPPDEIKPPEGAQPLELCSMSGQRAKKCCLNRVSVGPNKFKNVSTVTREFVRPGTLVDAYCEVHHCDEDSLDPVRVFPPPGIVDNPSPLGSANGIGSLAMLEPIRMTEPTIIVKPGEVDPYNSVRPLLRAQPVNEDGTNVERAVALEEEEPNAATPAPPPIDLPMQLKPPAPIRIE